MESKSDKQLSALNAVEKEIDNAKKIKDWIKIQAQFDQLNREVEAIARVASFHSRLQVGDEGSVTRRGTIAEVSK